MTFTSYKGMRQHLGKVHETKNKPSKCPKCNSSFRHKYALRFHIKQVHEKSTRATCPNCSKVMYNKYLVIKHLQRCNRALVEEYENEITA